MLLAAAQLSTKSIHAHAVSLSAVPYILNFIDVKPWPNGLASRRKFWTCVQLAFRLATHLHRLATTCMDLR